MHALDEFWYEELLSELKALDSETIKVDGMEMSPSQCYHIGLDPTHVLFNTNCPEELKEKINQIISKYRL